MKKNAAQQIAGTFPNARTIVSAVGAAMLVASHAAASTDDLVVETVATGLVEPVAVAAAPDGTIFVAQLRGEVRVVENGRLLDDPLVSIEVFVGPESGLTGIALDPDFDDNGFLYLFATVTEQEQQIIRVETHEPNRGKTSVIRDQIPSEGGLHSGGGLRIGPDRKLYFSVGDTGDPEKAARLNSLAGKICRINLDGTIPEDNPFKTPTGSTRAVFASGFRNVFRFCFDRQGNLIAGDIGSNGDERREEINIVVAGGDYGWPNVEGKRETPTTAETTIDPIFDYHDEGAGITGLIAINDDAWPDEFQGDLLHVDFVANGLYRVQLDNNNQYTHERLCELQGPVDLISSGPGEVLVAELYSGQIKTIRSATAPPWRETADPEPATNCGAGVLVAWVGSLSCLFFSSRRQII